MDRTVDKKSKEGRTIAKKEFFSDAEEEALQVRQTLLMMEGSHALNVPKINEVYTQAREAADNLLRILKHGNCISRILCPVLCMTTPPDNSNQSRKQSSGFKFFSKKKTKAKQAASQRSHMVLQATLPSPPIAEDSSVVYDLPYWPSELSARSNTLPCRVRKHSPSTGSSTLPSCFSRLSCKLDRKVWPIPPPPAIPAPNPPTHDAGTAVPFTLTQPNVDTPQNFHLRQGSNPQHHFHPRQGSSSQQHSLSHLTQVRRGSSSHRQDHLRQESNPEHHSHLRQEGNPQHHSHFRQEGNPQHHSHLRQGSNPQHHSHLRQEGNPQHHSHLRQGSNSQHHSHLRQEGNPQHHSHLRQEGNPQHHSHLRQEGNPQHHSHLRQEGNPQHHSHLRQGSSSHSTHNRVYPRPVSLGKISSIPPPEESGPEESGSEEYICHVCRGEANTATYMNVRPSSALLQMSDKDTEGLYMNIH